MSGSDDTIEQFIESAENDGTSEGRLVGEYARELLEDNPCDYTLLVSSLDEIIQVATWIRDRIQREVKP